MTHFDPRLNAAALIQTGSMSGGGADTADTTPPQLVSGPKDGQPADGNLVFTFNEAIQAGSGKLTFSTTSQYPTVTIFSENVATSPAITISGNTLTVHLPQRLDYATNYWILLDPNTIKDLAGNTFANYTTSFYFQSGLSPVALNLVGGDGADTLHGSDLADTISGGGGLDTIYGHGGNDLINGGDELSLYYANYGDRIDAGAGNDTVFGNGGDDYLQGGDGNDQLFGGDGRDWLIGGAGDDLLDGGAGNDQLSDDAGQNTLRGGDGDDYLSNDYNASGLLDGGSGNDILSGSDLASFVGGAGNDRITVAIRSIALPALPVSNVDAGDGDDTIDLTLNDHTTGHVRVTGGAGIDTYVLHTPWGLPDSSARVDAVDFKPGAGGDLINVLDLLAYNNVGNPFANGRLKLVADGNDTLLQVQLPNYNNTYLTLLHLDNVQPSQLTQANFVGGIDPAGSTKGMTLAGTEAADSLSGNLMDDVLSGLGGNDTMSGQGGNDSLDGGAGNDLLYGNAGNDTLAGGADDDALYDSEGNNTFLGGAGNDDLDSGSSGNNLLDGGIGNDTLYGGGGNDTLIGGDGDDSISVGAYGTNAHAVSVAGGEGKDSLIFSNDPGATVSASGGNGADTFKFIGGGDWGKVSITDFSPAQGDKLDLLDLLPRDLGSNPFGASGYLKAVQSGSDLTILADLDGAAGNAYAPIALVTLKNTDLGALPPSAFVGGIDPTGGTKGIALTGSAGADTLAGGWLDDTISGGDGKDAIDGGPGNDLIDGGDETVLGAGDMLSGGLGDDTIHGGAGFDTLIGGAGNDSLDGGDGSDYLVGSAGNDTLDGGAGNDALYDSQGSNVMHGGAGNDTIDAIGYYYYSSSDVPTAGDSTLDGGDGDDQLSAGRGNDVLQGGAGNDTLNITMAAASTQHVAADGGDGDDTFVIINSYTAVQSTIDATGGAGRDVYTFRGSYQTSTLTIEDFQTGPGGDVLDLLSLMSMMSNAPTANPFGSLGYLRLVASGADTLVQYDRDGAAGAADFVTVVVLKGVKPDSLTGDNFTQGIRPDGSSTGMTITGTDQADNIVGGLVDDTISGGAGNDTIDGGFGANVIHGNDGNDSIKVTDGKSQLFGDAGDDRLDGGLSYSLATATGSDTLSGGAGNDTLQTWSGDNVMNGDDGDDVLSATSTGHDRLSGGAGNDILTSNLGNDTLDGGDGDDKLLVNNYNFYPSSAAAADTRTVQLDGGSGRDQLSFDLGTTTRIDVSARGGADSDTFIVLHHPVKNTIAVTDFQAGAGGDLIDLSALASSITNPFATGGALSLVQRGADTVIQADPDGAGPLGMMDVLTLKNLDKSTLTPDNFWHGFNPDGSNTGLKLAGTDGADHLAGGYLDDTIAGGLGNDTLSGSVGNDSIDGGDGDDVLTGDQEGGSSYNLWNVRTGDDRVSGGAGNDKLFSYSGSDTLDGGAGNDTLVVADIGYTGFRSGDQVVANGGDGDDSFVFSVYTYTAMSVTMSGGAGQDTYSLPFVLPSVGLTITDFQAGAGGDVLDVFHGFWSGVTPFSGGYYQFVQRGADAVLQYSTTGSSPGSVHLDVLTLLNVDKTRITPDNTMGWPADGSTRGQVIAGTAGDDSLSGGPLDDTITGGLGNDTISGHGGNDSIDGGGGNDSIVGSYATNSAYGGDGDDIVDISPGWGLASGGAGNDHLICRGGATILDGGAGDDLLEAAYSSVFGPPHNIVMLGGDGNDTFLVQAWSDTNNPVTATGGAGRDVFEVGSAYLTQTGRYTVTDFQAGAGGDLIALGDLMKAADAGVNPFSDGHLRLLQSGSDTLLQYDWDGSAGAYGSFQTLLTLKNVQAAALIADNLVEHIDPHAGDPVPVPAPTPPPPVSSSPPPVPGVTATGTDATDKLTGSDGDDKLDAGAGDDVLHGGGGNDLLVGGDGRDLATYDGKLASYTISRDPSGWHVKDTAGSDGLDTLQGVERLQFADQAVALDLDGTAAQAYRIYRAAFDRTPNLAGLGYWISVMDKGASVFDLAGGFLHSKEFVDMYGSAPSNADFVARLYTNILHRAPDQAGYDYWLDVLNTKGADMIGVLASFSESTENQDAVAALIAGGIVFTPWHG